MYSYQGYLKYQNHYVPRLKSVKQKTFYPSVSIGKQIKGKLEIAAENFRAFYNIRGKLIHIVNLNRRSNYKYSYYYNKMGRLVKIVEINKATNALSKENTIIYKDEVNFVEYIREFIDGPYERTREIHHSKIFDSISEEQKNVDMDEWYLHQTLEYGDIKEEILDTSSDFQLVGIYEHNDNNQVIKSYFFDLERDEDGEITEREDKFEPKDYYLHTYFEDGLIKSESHISDDPWTRTYEYKYNSKGHWTEKIVCVDNSLEFICERELEYF